MRRKTAALMLTNKSLADAIADLDQTANRKVHFQSASRSTPFTLDTKAANYLSWSWHNAERIAPARMREECFERAI